MTSRTKKEEQKKDEGNVLAVLTATLADHKKSLSAEFNAAFTKLETKLESFESLLSTQHQRISSLETAATTMSDEIQTIQTELAAVTGENNRLKAKLTDLESRSRRNNARLVGLPEGIEGSHPTTFFSQLLLEVFGEDTLERAPKLDRAHRMLIAKPGPGEKPRAVIVCFHDYQTRELVTRKARELRGKLKYKNTPFHIFEDYCPEILQQRVAYRGVMKELYERGLKPALRYPAKLFIMTENGNRRFLPSPEEAKRYIDSLRSSSSSPPVE